MYPICSYCSPAVLILTQVMLLNVSIQVSLRDGLDGLPKDQRPKVANRYKTVMEGGKEKREVIRSNVSDVVRFLESHPAAKIMVFIETHCLENGRFIWKGENGDFQGCLMSDVSIFYSIIHAYYLSY